jgi:hypothetical protein
MIIEPVSVKVQHSIENTIRVARSHQNQSFIFRYDAVLTAVIVFLAFVIAIISMANDRSELNLIALFVFSAVPAVLVGLAAYGLRGILGEWLAKRRVANYFRSSPIMNEESIVEFSQVGIKTTGNLSSSFVKWEGITRAVESKTDLMFYTGTTFPGLYIPKNSFKYVADLDAVKNLLRLTLGERASLLKMSIG